MNYCKIIFLLLFPLELYAHKVNTWPLLIKNAQDAVALIEIADTESNNFTTLASGFFVQQNNLFVTNAHVISNILTQNPNNIKDAFSKVSISKNGKSYSIKSLKNISISDDLALLEVEGFPGPFLEITEPLLDEIVYIIGFPGGRFRRIKAHTFDFHLPRRFYSLFPHISAGENLGGFSGSPVLNNRGQVMGVASQSRPWYVGAVKSSFLIELIEKQPIKNLEKTVQEQMSSLSTQARKGDRESQYKLSELFFNSTQYFLNMMEFSIPEYIERFFRSDQFYFEQARKWSLKAAKQHHAIAQFNLAGIYLNGVQGMYKGSSDKKAYQWALRSAIGQYPYTKFLLGFYMYSEGVGTPVDEKKAFDWIYSAALNGHPRAAFEFGVLHLKGYSTSSDKEKALYWIKNSARMGSPLAQFVLGLMHFKGITLEKSAHKAFHFFEQAAHSGHNPSQLMLGLMLSFEFHTEESENSTYEWIFESMLEGRFALWADLLRGAAPPAVNTDLQTAADWQFIKWIVHDENSDEMDFLSLIQLAKDMEGFFSF